MENEPYITQPDPSREMNLRISELIREKEKCLHDPQRLVSGVYNLGDVIEKLTSIPIECACLETAKMWVAAMSIEEIDSLQMALSNDLDNSSINDTWKMKVRLTMNCLTAITKARKVPCIRQ